MTWHRYARLVRLPNLPTAVADVTLAALAVGALPARWPAFALLLLSSACLYMGGMVFNDYFDADEDRRDRPDRPIPSGRVSLAEARLLGWVLILGGVGFAGLTSWLLGGVEKSAAAWMPLGIALVLVAAIFAYDGW